MVDMVTGADIEAGEADGEEREGVDSAEEEVVARDIRLFALQRKWITDRGARWWTHSYLYDADPTVDRSPYYP